jgi:RNA polymerase-binding transcription factor DksA
MEEAAMIPIEELREALVAERHRVIERVARIEEDLRWFDSNVEPEIAEEGQEASLAHPLARLDDQGVAEIEAIDRALRRIDDGDYGRCEACRELIALDRLRALPSATTCAACATGAERNAF